MGGGLKRKWHDMGGWADEIILEIFRVCWEGQRTKARRERKEEERRCMSHYSTQDSITASGLATIRHNTLTVGPATF